MGVLDFLKPKKKLTKQELMAIHQQERILKDCLKIIQQTESIDTFFSRYKLAEDTVKTISHIAGENTPCIAGETPAACLESLYNEKEVQTNNCLARYVKKETVKILGLSRGRKAKALGVAEIIEVYADDMPADSLEHGRYLANKLIKQVEKLEKES